MKKLFLSILISLSFAVKATNLNVSKPVLYFENGAAYAVFNVSWENAWKNEKNNDGLWIFFKSISNSGISTHIPVSKKNHKIIATFSDDDPSLGFLVPRDQIGLFLIPTSKFRGKITATVKIEFNLENFKNIKARNSTLMVYGLEMVKIPKGGFEIGSTSEKALKHGAFYSPGKNGEVDGVFKIESEDQQIEISEKGDLYYHTIEGYEGDQKGTIISEYPKGVSPFYVMKYEPTEGQYVSFLNSLTTEQIANRSIIKEKNYMQFGGTIEEKDDCFFTTNPLKPCKFLSWDDAMAYADWAGLRPMTEFEYTKAARGVSKVQLGEFPWGTNNKYQIQRLPNEHGELKMLNGWNESELNDDTKRYFGASYYWVMDLSGSLWERVITIGHENGRRFRGTHGDGVLSASGNATNESWPIGVENSGGIGFRGGGFYGYDRDYHSYNPFSPIAFRPYGGWHGTMRTRSYGARFVRSVD